MALFRNPRPVVYGISVFVLAAIAAFGSRCRAEPIFQVEAGAAIIRGQAEVLGLTVLWPEAGPKDADFSLGLELIGSSRYGAREQPNQVGLQVQMVDGFGRFDIGLGIVFLQNTDAYNGSRANFSLLAGYRFTDRLSLIVRHWSNAGTTDHNLGRDRLLLTWRF